ncbi:hypothetical protein SAMN05660991_03476 [Trujillonella endophytica]|uniref:Uncharacterized protein n=1 Tax=Trujillonella endophytica TaxID=673521 RepID=A0A1H8VDE3_9ACTN|nr:hypothetical protein SAMN05660991_03476 [Trujillella endophytica]
MAAGRSPRPGRFRSSARGRRRPPPSPRPVPAAPPRPPCGGRRGARTGRPLPRRSAVPAWPGGSPCGARDPAAPTWRGTGPLRRRFPSPCRRRPCAPGCGAASAGSPSGAPVPPAPTWPGTCRPSRGSTASGCRPSPPPRRPGCPASPRTSPRRLPPPRRFSRSPALGRPGRTSSGLPPGHPGRRSLGHRSPPDGLPSDRSPAPHCQRRPAGRSGRLPARGPAPGAPSAPGRAATRPRAGSGDPLPSPVLPTAPPATRPPSSRHRPRRDRSHSAAATDDPGRRLLPPLARTPGAPGPLPTVHPPHRLLDRTAPRTRLDPPPALPRAAARGPSREAQTAGGALDGATRGRPRNGRQVQPVPVDGYLTGCRTWPTRRRLPDRGARSRRRPVAGCEAGTAPRPRPADPGPHPHPQAGVRPGSRSLRRRSGPPGGARLSRSGGRPARRCPPPHRWPRAARCGTKDWMNREHATR